MNGLFKYNSADAYPPDFSGGVPLDPRVFYVTWLSICLSLTVGIINSLVWYDLFHVIALCLGLVVTLLCLPLIRKAHYDQATTILAVAMFLLITVISTNGLGIHHVSTLGFPAVLIIASLVVRKPVLIFLTAFAVACVAWLVFGELTGMFQLVGTVSTIPGDFIIVMIILCATAIMARAVTETLYQNSIHLKKELTERKKVEEQLAHDALHDALTGLPNRTLFNDRLGQRLEFARRHPDSLFAVLFIDLDRFKVVNDSLGHLVGDQLLIETAKRLAQCIRSEDSIARLSGDEFAILLNSFSDINDAVHIAERIEARLASTTMLGTHNRTTTASIGIAVANNTYQTPHEMLRDADSAMYRAKAQGGGRFAIFDDTMYASALALLQLEADLKRAVENKEWLIYYQPIVTSIDRTVIGFEALVRWAHPDKGIIQPPDFLRVAEETGLILPIGEYVLREACKQVKVWRDNGHPDVWISVNLSRRQFEYPNIVNVLENVLTETGLPGEALHLELTDSTALSDAAYSARVLNQFDQIGIRNSLDDFGIGYSTFAHLNKFPIKTIKIGRSFVSEIVTNAGSKAIVTAIVDMCHALKLNVIAEGVETEEQLACLKAIDCDRIQGYLVSPAVPAENLGILFTSHTLTGKW